MINETFFRFNRFALLGGIVACLLLPLWNITLPDVLGIQQPLARFEKFVVSYDYLSNAPQSAEQINQPTEDSSTDQSTKALSITEQRRFPLFGVLMAVYLLGVAVMTIRLALSLYSLWRLIRRHSWQPLDNYRLIVSPEAIMPFSFGKYIVVSEADYQLAAAEIVLHEQMHLKHKHSWDVMFCELLTIVFWFNPAVWLMARDLREIHEYEADKGVLDAGINPQTYQMLLLQKAVGQKRMGQITHQLRQSKVRGRIMMMLRRESQSWRRLKLLGTLPLLAITMLAFSQPEVVSQNPTLFDNGGTIDDHELKDFYTLMRQRMDNNAIIVFLNTTNDVVFLSQLKHKGVILSSDVEDKEQAIGQLQDIIQSKVRTSSISALNFSLIAPENAQMAVINHLKSIMLTAYHRSVNELSQTGVASESLGFPLSIKYTTHRYVAEGEPNLSDHLLQIVQ